MASIGVELQQSRTGAFPIGQPVTLPGHFPGPVVLEAVRPIGAGYECRVRLPDGTPDEAINLFGPLLTVLRLMLVVAEDPETAHFVARLDKRRAHADAELRARKSRVGQAFRGNREWGKRLADLRIVKLSRAKRRRIARRAARSRWAKERGRPC